jgi:hypothetical protein
MGRWYATPAPPELPARCGRFRALIILVLLRFVPVHCHSLPAFWFSGLDGVKSTTSDLSSVVVNRSVMLTDNGELCSRRAGGAFILSGN